MWSWLCLKQQRQRNSSRNKLLGFKSIISRIPKETRWHAYIGVILNGFIYKENHFSTQSGDSEQKEDMPKSENKSSEAGPKEISASKGKHQEILTP